MINLQAELKKYREQEALCATFLARYRYDEWEALDPAVREQERADFLAAQKAYRIPFARMNLKCWMKRALSLLAWDMCRGLDDLTDEKIEEIVEEEDRFVAHLAEAFVRVFPQAEWKVSNKVTTAQKYYEDLRRRYRREAAQNGYYAMIADAISWGEYEGDTPIVVPARVLRLAGDEPELVMLAALFHYRKPGNKVVIQGDFNNWYDASLGNGGEQRLTNLVAKLGKKMGSEAYVTSMRAGTEKNAPSRFFLAPELQWDEGEPGIVFEDDGCHLLATQLRSLSNLLQLFPKRRAELSDEQIGLLADIAKANLRTQGTPRLVGKPEEDGFYLDQTMAERFAELFGAAFGGNSMSLENLRRMPEVLRKRVFAEAWKAAVWLEPPYSKKLSETGKALSLQAEQSKDAWNTAIVLLIHRTWFGAHEIRKAGCGKYDFVQVPMIGPEEAAAYGSDAKSAELFAVFEETAAWMAQENAKMLFRFKRTKADEKAGAVYQYTILMEKKEDGKEKHETSVDMGGSAGASAWWLHT